MARYAYSSLGSTSSRGSSPPPPYSQKASAPPAYPGASRASESTPLFWREEVRITRDTRTTRRTYTRRTLRTGDRGIGISGAGPAGISAAQHLLNSQAAHDVRFNITILEAGPSIGGQLAPFGSGSGPVFPYNDSTLDPLSAEDLAGLGLMWSSPLFTHDSKAILRDEIEFVELPSQKVGHYSADGQLIIETTRPYRETSFGDWAGLVWHYGSSVWDGGRMLGEGDLGGAIRDMALASPTLPHDIHALLARLGIAGLAQELATDTLNSRHISDKYVREVLAPQVERGAHGQVPAMSGLALVMAAAQADAAAKHAGGGDFTARLARVVASLHGGVEVRTHSKVTGLRRSRRFEDKREGEGENRTEEIWLLRHEGFGHVEYEAFDRVILAAPGLEQQLTTAAAAARARHESDDEDDDGSDSDDFLEIEEAVEYDAGHVTFFTVSEPLQNPVPGAAAADAMGDDGEVTATIVLPPQALFVDRAAGGVHEVSHVREVVRHHWDNEDVDNGGSTTIEHLYRCVSSEDISERLRADPAVTWVHHQQLDHAWPLTLPRTRYPSFQLGNGLWTTSPIHSITSTVDLSWLAGKIVARQLIDTAK